MQRRGTAGFGDRRCERDFLGTDSDTVLRIAALLNPAGRGERIQTLGLLHLACGMRVEEDRLAYRMRTYEAFVVG